MKGRLVDMDTPLNAALDYLTKFSLSVIPVSKDKKPFIKWEEYQRRLPTTEEVKKWWQDFPEAQVGIVTGILSGLCAFDTDDADADKAFQELIPDSLLVPTVTTPRGGRHYYFKCTDPALTNKAMLLGKKMDFRANGGYILAPPSTNGRGNQYAYLEGLSIEKNALSPLPDKVLHIFKGMHSINSFSSYRDFVDIPVDTNLLPSTKVYRCLQEGRRDNDLFHIANALIKNQTPIDEVRELLEILAKNCNPPFPEKEIAKKIESALRRTERKERNLAQEVEDWVCLQNGYFLSTEIYKYLQVSTREEKKNIWIILKRLCDKGLIERHGTKSGQYRLLDTSLEEIDLYAQDDEEISIKWPFGIEKLVKTMSKNIVILAGVSNAGKTAFLLNVIEQNMDIYDIHYFISEMGKAELKSRLQKFDRPLKSWKFHSYERTGNFADVIKPNAINIIDFLEIYHEHYMIGQWIKDIYDRLNKGIAIIAIQKKPGAAVGVGGITTLEKARLYLNIDSGRLKIEKGKNWTSELKNPNGLELHFKLIKGCKFLVVQDWEKKEI